LLLSTACEAPDGHEQIAARNPQTGPPAPAAVEFAELTEGDTVLGLLVDSIAILPDPADGFGWMGSVDYSGVVPLTGEYRSHGDFPEVREICFFADDSSAVRLPRFPNDARRPWFCFTNQDRAVELFGGPGATGRARVVIDRYLYLYRHTDVYNRARLVRVEAKF
jgi:hypothetical protein